MEIKDKDERTTDENKFEKRNGERNVKEKVEMRS